MRFPAELRAAVDAVTAEIPHFELARAAAELSVAYRGSNPCTRMDSNTKLGAYLQVRMPATFAAAGRVFNEIAVRFPEWQPRSMLDLGAGPGTAMWAAAEVFPSIQSFTLLEKDAAMCSAGERLAKASSTEAIRQASWRQGDLAQMPRSKTDLIVMSYVLGELTTDAQRAAIESARAHAGDLLVIISPGTPVDFQTVLAARQQLLGAGMHILAPCPHEVECPMASANDWCHFSQRLERSSEHRKLKGAELGYEDEKFSYLIASRTAHEQVSGRIVRHPLKYAGHVKLHLCTGSGLKQSTITKSQRKLYRKARRAEWGDVWSEE